MWAVNRMALRVCFLGCFSIQGCSPWRCLLFVARSKAMGCKRICLCCLSIPVSVLVLAVAVVIPLLAPKHTCEVDDAGLCKKTGGAAHDGSCDAGVFLQTTLQPTVALKRIAVDGDLVFAESAKGECHIKYSVSCGKAGVEIKETWDCSTSKSSVVQFNKLGYWEVCAKQEDSPLQLSTSLIDLTYDIVMSAGTKVTGCVRVSSPATLPHLDAVRGSLEEQNLSLQSRKRETGGCPHWGSIDDRLQRGEDYAVTVGRAYAFVVRQYMAYHQDFLKQSIAGGFPEGAPPLHYLLFIGLMATGGGEHGMLLAFATTNCGAPAISVLPIAGPAVTRHKDVSELLADPKQERLVGIGAGYSDVCFDVTLPVFVSTGTPEHTQVRKLWDAVGLDTMHEKELPALSPPEPGLLMKIRKVALGAVGLTAPMMDELAPLVTPLFLAGLWGRVPTAEETSVISTYPSVGGPCILSPVLEKMPILPGKVRAVRQAALDFAKSSPVGKHLADEIQKDDYSELREQYKSRPKGVVDTALLNLADASLFAGLVGTSTMTMNCALQQHRGPKFVKMFRENQTAFMIETMRTATAVAGSMRKTSADMEMVVEGHRFVLPRGSRLAQPGGGAAGLDGAVFPDPFTFDSRRDNLGETLNWNGLTKHVLSKNYTGAPRFCPGAAMSIKIAAKVCEYVTQDLSAA
eukprot:TRINITY_DN18212_c0_g1_i1.p1 TRINITY_DN18212_c0_g1~~TRINITY_DN18212_c0_g1_i1.p1  ORF type:complete len:686 (-),score=96.88 TRINITY_DN18212_c0_g1_i1:276-2333(-)